MFIDIIIFLTEKISLLLMYGCSTCCLPDWHDLCEMIAVLRLAFCLQPKFIKQLS